MTNRFNTKNPILDYEQVQDILNKLVSDESGRSVVKQSPIGVTEFGYDIEHYTIGTGKNHVVYTGATHGSEVITTDFILQLMDEIKNEKDKFKYLDSGEYTLHFVPMCNPEGYIITTSAIREKIPRDMEAEDAEKFCKQYYLSYRQDDIDYNKELVDPKLQKNYQKMFEDVDYTCISDEHLELKESVKNIMEKSNAPKGSIIAWSANGSGIDCNANAYTNPKVTDVNMGRDTYGKVRYSNINTSVPGPFNCPTKKKGYVEEKETTAMLDFMIDLSSKKDEKLCANFSYHSVGGVIYHEPYNSSKERPKDKFTREFNRVYNKKIAEVYKESTDYRLMEQPVLDAVDEYMRVIFPGTLIIELSKMGGNPIGPYGDLNGNYENTIETNLNAVEKITEKLPHMKELKDKYEEKLKTKKTEKDDR